MSQHDQNIANDNGANVRSDINSALAALFGLSSGASAPSTTIAYMLWADTTTGFLKQRNAANSAWVTIGHMASTAFGVVNRAYGEYASNTNLTTVIPYDDTIPQITEGTEIISVSITPKSTTSRIRVTVQGVGTIASGSSQAIIALFQDSTADALAASASDVFIAGHQMAVGLQFEHVPATTSAITYRLRAGPNSSGAMRMNGTDAARRFGGVEKVTMVVQEIPV